MQRKNINKNNLKKIRQIIIIFALFLCVTSFSITFGRYVTNSVNDFFVRSKEFYFNSDKLSDKRAVFQIENWSGVDDYPVLINMNSRKNNIQAASYDIAYDITYTCSSNAICQLDKTSGVISKESNTDSFLLTITPNAQLETGDKITVEIKAKATEPYEKTLTGKFTLVVGQEDLTYQITDKPNNPYMELSVTNTLTYYVVEEDFDGYTAKQKIDIDTYLGLTDEQKAKCHSCIITVSFDPNIILLDLTNENYRNATNIKTTTINGKTYINSLDLPIDAISSVDLRFYKVDTSQDYTYPNAANYSVVSVTPN